MHADSRFQIGSYTFESLRLPQLALFWVGISKICGPVGRCLAGKNDIGILSGLLNNFVDGFNPVTGQAERVSVQVRVFLYRAHEVRPWPNSGVLPCFSSEELTSIQVVSFIHGLLSAAVFM